MGRVVVPVGDLKGASNLERRGGGIGVNESAVEEQLCGNGVKAVTSVCFGGESTKGIIVKRVDCYFQDVGKWLVSA